MTVIRRRQIGFTGNILRGSSLEKECLLGMIFGRRARGRQRLKYMDSIKELVGCGSMSEVVRIEVCGVPFQPMSTWTRHFIKVRIAPKSRTRKGGKERGEMKGEYRRI